MLLESPQPDIDHKDLPPSFSSNFEDRLEIIQENSISLANRNADSVAEFVSRKDRIMISFEHLEMLTNQKKGICTNKPATGAFCIEIAVGGKPLP